MQKKKNFCDADINNIIISKLFETKNNFKYLIRVIRPLVLILPKWSEYVKIIKVKYGDKNKNTKLMSFGIDDDKLLEKYKTTWNNTEDLKKIIEYFPTL